MEPVNLNGKILLIPMNAIDPQVRAAIKQEDGMQSVNGADIFVYATGQLEEHHCCCGGHGHHHDEENGEEHHCCGGHGHHHDEENGEEHHCCGGHGHHHDEENGEEHHCCHSNYDADEEDETFIDDDEYENYEGEEDEEELGTIRVIDEPIVIINASQAQMIGFTPTEDMYFKISPDGLTLLPGAKVDHGDTQTGPITIRLDEE